MSIAGILTQDQATENNLAASVKQWLYQNVLIPYNTAATAAGLNAGMQLQADGTWKSEPNGLAILYAEPTDESLYEYVPVVGYKLDSKPPSKDPEPTGAGDMANWEYRTIGFCFLPAISVSTDGAAFQSDRSAQFLLKSHAANAILRTKILPIVDATQAPTNPLPQIGYAEVIKANLSDLHKELKLMTDTHKLRFDGDMEIRWAVQSTN